MIESLIAFCLVALALAGGIKFYQFSNELYASAYHKKMALEMIDAKLESLKKAGYASLPAPETPDVQTLALAGISAQQTVSTVNVDDPVDGITDYKQVTVALNWTEAAQSSQQHTLEETTIIGP